MSNEIIFDQIIWFKCMCNFWLVQLFFSRWLRFCGRNDMKNNVKWRTFGQRDTVHNLSIVRFSSLFESRTLNWPLFNEITFNPFDPPFHLYTNDRFYIAHLVIFLHARHERACERQKEWNGRHFDKFLSTAMCWKNDGFSCLNSIKRNYAKLSLNFIHSHRNDSVIHAISINFIHVFSGHN